MPCKLSINLNKIALIRNSRGKNYPDLVQVAKDCERFGGQGITIHPRPDQRHAKYSDIRLLKEHISIELNVEGYPSDTFLKIVEKEKPHQVTLVPDSPDAITSNAGWKIKKNKVFLTQIISHLKKLGIRTSIFVECDLKNLDQIPEIETDRVELYTEDYAENYSKAPKKAIEKYIKAARFIDKLGVGLNAGHDLNINNLRFFVANIPNLLEVSIGHALVSDALYFGLQATIPMYLRQIDNY